MSIDPWSIAGSEYTPQELRLGTVVPFVAGSLNSVGVRAGVRGTTAATDLLVQAQSTPNMTVKVNPGVAVIQGSTQTAQGAYTYVLTTAATVDIGTAHGSQIRKDLIVARVRDALVTGSTTDGAPPVVVQGVPGAGTPALPTDGSYLILGEVNVGAAVTTITSGNVADRRVFLAGPGASIPWIGVAPSNMPKGQLNHDVTSGQPYSWSGTANRKILDETSGVVFVYGRRKADGLTMLSLTGDSGPVFDKTVSVVAGSVHRIRMKMYVSSTVSSDSCMVKLFLGGTEIDGSGTVMLGGGVAEYSKIIIETNYVLPTSSAAFSVTLTRRGPASTLHVPSYTNRPFEFSVWRLTSNTALMEF